MTLMGDFIGVAWRQVKGLAWAQEETIVKGQHDEL